MARKELFFGHQQVKTKKKRGVRVDFKFKSIPFSHTPSALFLSLPCHPTSHNFSQALCEVLGGGGEEEWWERVDLCARAAARALRGTSGTTLRPFSLCMRVFVHFVSVVP